MGASIRIAATDCRFYEGKYVVHNQFPCLDVQLLVKAKMITEDQPITPTTAIRQRYKVPRAPAQKNKKNHLENHSICCNHLDHLERSPPFFLTCTFKMCLFKHVNVFVSPVKQQLLAPSVLYSTSFLDQHRSSFKRNLLGPRSTVSS